MRPETTAEAVRVAAIERDLVPTLETSHRGGTVGHQLCLRRLVERRDALSLEQPHVEREFLQPTRWQPGVADFTLEPTGSRTSPNLLVSAAVVAIGEPTQVVACLA